MVALLVLASLVLVAGTARRLGRFGALLLATVSVLWLVVNSPMEGKVILVVSSGRGLTAGDVAGLMGLAVALVWLVRD